MIKTASFGTAVGLTTDDSIIFAYHPPLKNRICSSSCRGIFIPAASIFRDSGVFPCFRVMREIGASCSSCAQLFGRGWFLRATHRQSGSMKTQTTEGNTGAAASFYSGGETAGEPSSPPPPPLTPPPPSPAAVARAWRSDFRRKGDAAPVRIITGINQDRNVGHGSKVAHSDPRNVEISR